MAAKRKKNKKKSKVKAAAADDVNVNVNDDVHVIQPRRSRLTAAERLRVENMHEILGEVWEPFKTAEGAIRGLETDAAPWLELEFWDSLAEAFLRYFGKAITLQVDTAGLARAQAAIEIARSKAAAQSLRTTSTGGIAETMEMDPAAATAAASGSTTDDNHGHDGPDSDKNKDGGDKGSGSHMHRRRGGGGADADGAGDTPGEEGEEEEGLGSEAEALEASAGVDPSTKKLEMLPMEAVGHLGRGDRLGIIKKTVPVERRMLVLQRLFHLAQAPAEEVKLLVASVKELKSASSSAEIRDVNLLETWQGVREERATAWDHAMEKVRLVSIAAIPSVAVGAADSPPPPSTAPDGATATANGDGDVDVGKHADTSDGDDDIIGIGNAPRKGDGSTAAAAAAVTAGED